MSKEIGSDSKSASTISRELLGLVKGGAASKKIGEMNAKILEAQQFALSAQADQFSLSKRVSDIEKELVGLKDFRSEKQNYQFQAIGRPPLLTFTSHLWTPPNQHTGFAVHAATKIENRPSNIGAQTL